MTVWGLSSSSWYCIIPLTFFTFIGFYSSRFDPLYTISSLCYSDQITSLPSPSPRTSASSMNEFLERVGSLKPSMNGFFLGFGCIQWDNKIAQIYVKPMLKISMAKKC